MYGFMLAQNKRYNLNPNKDNGVLISILSIANVYFQMLIQIGCKQPSLSNREGGGNDASWTAQANTHIQTVHELVWYKQSHTLSLDTWGSQQCTKKIQGCNIFIKEMKKKKKSRMSLLRPEISNAFPSHEVNWPHSLKPHRSSPQDL